MGSSEQTVWQNSLITELCVPLGDLASMNKVQSDWARLPISILSLPVYRHAYTSAQLYLYMCERAYRHAHIPYTHTYLYKTNKKKVLIEFVLYWVSTRDSNSGKGTWITAAEQFHFVGYQQASYLENKLCLRKGWLNPLWTALHWSRLFFVLNYTVLW